jgi:hypothetical protein
MSGSETETYVAKCITEMYSPWIDRLTVEGFAFWYDVFDRLVAQRSRIREESDEEV